VIAGCVYSLIKINKPNAAESVKDHVARGSRMAGCGSRTDDGSCKTVKLESCLVSSTNNHRQQTATTFSVELRLLGCDFLAANFANENLWKNHSIFQLRKSVSSKPKVAE